MKANSRSDIVLELLYHAKALLLSDGFSPPYSSLLQQNNLQKSSKLLQEAWSDIQTHYTHQLVPGSEWPKVQGTFFPKAVIICQNDLSDHAKEFVRTWFENPKVGLNLQEDCWLQSLPCFNEQSSTYVEYFDKLLALLRPLVVLSLGEVPAQFLLQVPASIETLRSSDYRFSHSTLVTTLSPELFFEIDSNDHEAQKAFKAQVWKDIQRIIGKIRYV